MDIELIETRWAEGVSALVAHLGLDETAHARGAFGQAKWGQARGGPSVEALLRLALACVVCRVWPAIARHVRLGGRLSST